MVQKSPPAGPATEADDNTSASGAAPSQHQDS
jgi:hypothetical protein